jgi:hypothetical protein
MKEIRYLLDENIDPIFRTELLRKEPQLLAWRIGDPGTPKSGTLDDKILIWCEENDFILVTNNRKTMPTHLSDHLAEGRHVPGILTLDPDMSIGEIIDELLLIWGASDASEYQDLILYLPLT